MVVLHVLPYSFPRSVKTGHAHECEGINDDYDNGIPSDPQPQHLTDCLRVTPSPETKRDRNLRYVRIYSSSSNFIFVLIKYVPALDVRWCLSGDTVLLNVKEIL